jgi:hypothetical protein
VLLTKAVGEGGGEGFVKTDRTPARIAPILVDAIIKCSASLSSITGAWWIFPAPGKSVRLAVSHGTQIFYATDFD